jgi:Flp pilus assembly protein TadG
MAMTGPILNLARSIKTYFVAENGATAVEFALIAPPFFWMFMSMFETGLMLFSEFALQSGVQEAGRKIRTGQAYNSGWTANEFVAEVCESATIIRECEQRLSVYVRSVPATFDALKSSLPENKLTIGPSAPGGAPIRTYNHGNASTATGVFVTLDWDFIVPFMSPFGNIDSGSRRLVAYSIFLNEPFRTSP